MIGGIMNPIQKLMAEHQIILKGIAIFDKKLKEIESGEMVDTVFLKKAIDFIRNYADKYHHAKEENILFAKMEKAGFPKDTGPVAVMLYEHAEGREFISGLEIAISRYEDGDVSVRGEIIVNGTAYTSLLRNHIQKEDNILYPMAVNLLGDGVLSQMQAAFDDIESSFPGLETKYLKILEIKD
jgi:hemerythrin-like domain-containing protein